MWLIGGGFQKAIMKSASLAQSAEIENGITTLQSSRPIDEVVRQLQDLLARKGVKLFSIVDHAAEAREVGLEMPPTILLMFGNPKAGTPIMLASPSSAIDLPLKILVAQGEHGTVRLSYNSAGYLQARHSIPDEFLNPLNGVADLLADIL